MPVVNERDIVDDENARLADSGKILDHAFRVEQPIAAAVEGPGAAKRAVPRATPREFDRGARVEQANEIFAAVAHQIARGPDLFEALDKAGPRTLAIGGDGAGHLGDGAAIARDGFKQLDDGRLAFAFEHAIDGAFAVFHNGVRGEGGAVAADADESARQSELGGLCQVDDLGHIGKIVAGKGDEIRLPLGDHAAIVGVAFDLQIDEPGRMAVAPRGLCHQFEAQRLEAQEDVGIEQWARMDEQQFHVDLRSECSGSVRDASDGTTWYSPHIH